MKIIWLSLVGVLLSFIGFAQQSEIVVFKHELRWVDENKFPNYFLSEEVRESIFSATEHEIVNYLKLMKIKLPENVSYKIINGFGKQKIKMPKSNSKNDYEVGIFSFITRGTVGYSILWKFNLVIKKKGKVILKKEVVHELEYFNVSGYLTLIKWLEADEFQDIFIQLLKESLGVLPASNEVIIVSSIEKQEEKAKTLFTESTRHLLRVNGDWLVAGNFVGQLESPIDTIMNFQFKEKVMWEFPKLSFEKILTQSISLLTGVEVNYSELVDYEKKGVLVFSDGDEFGILLKWIQIETSSVFSDEVSSQRTLDPLVAELYSKEKQIGYFVYVQKEIVHTTDKTEEKLNMFTGYQTENSLGIERIHLVAGNLHNRPLLVEYHENRGIIEVRSNDELLGVMVVQNLNPDNNSVSKNMLSKNKRNVSKNNLGKPSLKKTKSVEWFPVYLPNDFSDESGKLCIESLIFLFFGIGNM